MRVSGRRDGDITVSGARATLCVRGCRCAWRLRSGLLSDILYMRQSIDVCHDCRSEDEAPVVDVPDDPLRSAEPTLLGGVPRSGAASIPEAPRSVGWPLTQRRRGASVRTPTLDGSLRASGVEGEASAL